MNCSKFFLTACSTAVGQRHVPSAACYAAALSKPLLPPCPADVASHPTSPPARQASELVSSAAAAMPNLKAYVHVSTCYGGRCCMPCCTSSMLWQLCGFVLVHKLPH